MKRNLLNEVVLSIYKEYDTILVNRFSKCNTFNCVSWTENGELRTESWTNHYYYQFRIGNCNDFTEFKMAISSFISRNFNSIVKIPPLPALFDLIWEQRYYRLHLFIHDNNTCKRTEWNILNGMAGGLLILTIYCISFSSTIYIWKGVCRPMYCRFTLNVSMIYVF